MIVSSAIELLEHHEYGECAVAARDVRAGEIVIEETPVMVIDYRIDLLADTVPKDLVYKRKRAFMTLSHTAKVSLHMAQEPETTKALMKVFFIPAPKSSTVRKSLAYNAALRGVRELRARVQLFPEIELLQDEQLVAYSMLASANAHSLDTLSIALLELGCKVTHSCFAPNVAVSSRLSRASHGETEKMCVDSISNSMKHIALVDIRKGEILFGTYAKLTTQFANERRHYLSNHKMFKCRCRFCIAPDKTRGIQCLSCAAEVVAGTVELPVPVSTMHLSPSSDGTKSWKCSNCKTEESQSAISKQLSSTIGGESDFRKSLTKAQTDMSDTAAALILAQNLYFQATSTFGWRHTLTASAALLFMDICSKAIDVSCMPNTSQLEIVLKSYETIPQLLEEWFSQLGVSPIEELASLYLFSSEQLMTLSSLRHDLIPRSMSIVQDLLLKVRPLIEERRSWPIGHALEEYYDEMLQTLDGLVNGIPDDQVRRPDSNEVLDEEIDC